MNDYSDNIAEFIETGVTVFENVFSNEEVDAMRKCFHDELLLHNINHDQVLAGMQEINHGTRLKSPASNFYYGKWKIDALINEKIYTMMKTLMLNTFNSDSKLFSHPYGKFNDIVPYIDRACWRLPDHIRTEGGLEMHMDRNPIDPYLLKGDGLLKWRPIQTILTLTDHWDGNTGGLEVVKGFHKIFDEFFAKDYEELSKLCPKGEFYRMTSKKYDSLRKKLQPILASKGSLICWDNRLPHATASNNFQQDTREVLYGGLLLPNVPLNIKYHQEQLKCLENNLYPPAYAKDGKDNNGKTIKCDRDWVYPDDLTEFQKKFLI
jgi:hypothetical protein